MARGLLDMLGLVVPPFRKALTDPDLSRASLPHELA